jgi:hypothetical protein
MPKLVGGPSIVVPRLQYARSQSSERRQRGAMLDGGGFNPKWHPEIGAVSQQRSVEPSRDDADDRPGATFEHQPPAENRWVFPELLLQK